MIAAFLVMALADQDRPANLERDPGVVVSKMFEKYYRASSLSGTIVQTISDGGGAKKITTLLSYQRPNKIYIQQDYVHPNGLKANLTSDGKVFAYDPPLKLKPKPRERLYEPVELPRQGTSAVTFLAIGDMYHAAHLSLAPSTLLDLAVAYKTHLEDYSMVNVANHRLVGVVDYQGRQAYHIAGFWRQAAGSDPTGKFEIWISTDFDLLKFVLSENYNVQGRAVALTTTEVADLKVNVAVNQDLFKVVLPSGKTSH
jgi:outer membrane lipoprotein-sorting protein